MPYTKQHAPWVEGTTVIHAADMDGIESGVAAAIGNRPHEFRVENYGAVGDGKAVADVATTSGSPTITSASAGWTAADVGKHIMVHGGLDAAGGPLISTILTVNSATSVTLAANATRTGTGLPTAWGTDDTAAINNAVNAASAYAMAHNWYAEVIFASKVYVLAAQPVQQTSPVIYNAQIRIPYGDTSGDRKLEIGFIGAGPGDHCHYWSSTIPNMMGTTLLSMATGPATQDATYYRQSVLGAPSSNAGFTGNFVNAKANIEGLQIVCPAYTNLTAFDFTFLGGVSWKKCGAHIFANPLQGPEPLLNTMVAQAFFQGTAGVGICCPANGDNADNWFDSAAVEGFNVGVRFGDHTSFGRLATIYSNIAGVIDSTSGLTGVGHGLFVGNWTNEVYNGGLYVNGGYVGIDIFMSSECTGVTYDLKDLGNSAHGYFKWHDPADNRLPTVQGAGNVTFHNFKNATVQQAAAVYNRSVALTDAATITTDASLGNVFTVTIAGSRTIAAPTNPVDGEELTYVITQGGSGSYTITWNAVFDWGSFTHTLQTAVGSHDAFHFVYVAALSKWVHVK